MPIPPCFPRQYLVTSYTSTLDAVTLSSIISILIADCVTTPVLSAVNPAGRFKRAFLAPKVRQEG
jgi:hypothetical protein